MYVYIVEMFKELKIVQRDQLVYLPGQFICEEQWPDQFLENCET